MEDTIYYKLKASGKEFHVMVEEEKKVVWRFRYSIVDNVDDPANLERASNWKRTKSPSTPSTPKAGEDTWPIGYFGC